MAVAAERAAHADRKARRRAERAAAERAAAECEMPEARAERKACRRAERPAHAGIERESAFAGTERVATGSAAGALWALQAAAQQRQTEAAEAQRRELGRTVVQRGDARSGSTLGSGGGAWD
jgi:hypothetical protein